MVRALSAALVVVLGAGTDVYALHRETPGITRVTKDATHLLPPTRSWGTFLPFTSSQDLAQNGNTTQQIFLFKLLNYACQHGFPEVGTVPLCANPPEPYLVQVTNRPGSPANPSVTAPPNGPASAQWLAFDADGILNGDTGPASGFRQIFLKNLTTEELRQITFGTDGDSIRPSPSSQGGVIVFESTASLGGAPNPSGASQIYLYERDARLLRRLTFGSAPSTNAIPNQNGSLIAFQSTAALLGDGLDTGVSQIFYVVFDKVNHNVLLRQLTNGGGPSTNPFVAEGGERFIVFDSTATNLIPGFPGGGGREIYVSGKIPGCVRIGSAPRACDSGSRVGQSCESDIPCVGGTIGTDIHRLVSSARFGDCSFPSLSESSDRVAFICTGDPLDNGTTGNRVFVLDLQRATLFQQTGTGDVQGPVAMNLGNWFVAMSSTADLAQLGSCGYQLYVIDFYSGGDSAVPNKWIPATQPGQLPPDSDPPTGGQTSTLIGKRNFVIQPGTVAGGTSALITTSAGTSTHPLTGNGSMSLVIGAPSDFTGQASIAIPQAEISFPPIPLPTFGTMCLTASGDGSGLIDCDGISPAGDILVSQDHDIFDVNPGCVGGCREGASCQGELHGTHVMPCPVCVNNVCQGGAVNGQPCSSDLNCQAECVDGTIGVCNGPVLGEPTGTFVAGGMQISVPVTISISRDPGVDLKFCTPDDRRAVNSVPAIVRLTTGAASSAILDADNAAGSNLMATDTGAPFSCSALQARTMAGARLVGFFPLLHVPEVPTLHDVIVGLRLEPKPDPGVCNGPCAGNVDCDDGNPCNGAETCVSGGCIPGPSLPCDDNNICNGIETCDALSGVCTLGTPCDDGDACNGVETCTGIACLPGTPTVCTDNDACNGLETCDPISGACSPGTLPVCDDSNPCTDDSCDPTQGCVNVNNDTNPCDDGSLCTSGDACIAGLCTGTPLPCDDNDACNGFETCDPSAGTCLPSVPPDCNDNNSCTDDSCDPLPGCVNTANDANPCDDASVCTSGDACVGGQCTGAPLVCDDNDACNGVEPCDPVSGCQTGTPPLCDDGNPCTTDSCDAVLGCLFVNNTDPCDDGTACTTGDTCQGGQCTGAVVACDDGDGCNGVEGCDPLSGLCQPGWPLVCDDGNPCTTDSCDAVLGCLFTNNTDPCDDGALCTSGDVCQGGQCTGMPLACDDGDGCNGVETCDPLSGCQPGTPLVCDDGNPCTTDSCDAVLGCLFANNTDPCDDGAPCTTADTCQSGLCAGTPVPCDDGDACNGLESCNPSTGSCEPAVPLSCDDGNPCTTDSCDSVLGCVNASNTNPCDDGSTCTIGDTCSAGACVGTPVVSCDDGDACNGAETCDPLTGTCQAGTPIVCDDGDACTLDSCNPGTGTCEVTPSLVCALDALAALVSGADPADLGGARRQSRLLGRIMKARAKAEGAATAAPGRASTQLKAAQRLVLLFQRAVRRGMTRGRIDPVLGDQLITNASQIIGEMGALRNGT